MRKKDLIRDTLVRNIKHGTDELILDTGIMKIGEEWVPCVIYTGEDCVLWKIL